MLGQGRRWLDGGIRFGNPLLPGTLIWMELQGEDIYWQWGYSFMEVSNDPVKEGLPGNSSINTVQGH